jgi:hypothetical protein
MKAKEDKNFIHVHRLTPKECGNNTGTVDFKHLKISGEFNPNTHGIRLHDLPVWRGCTQKFHHSLLNAHGMVDG